MKLITSIIAIVGVIGLTLGWLNAASNNKHLKDADQARAFLQCELVKEIEGAGDATCTPAL